PSDGNSAARPGRAASGSSWVQPSCLVIRPGPPFRGTPAAIYPQELLLLRLAGFLGLEHRVRRRQPRDRQPVRGARDVIQPGPMEEDDRVGIAAVLAAHADLHAVPDPARSEEHT